MAVMSQNATFSPLMSTSAPSFSMLIESLAHCSRASVFASPSTDTQVGSLRSARS